MRKSVNNIILSGLYVGDASQEELLKHKILQYILDRYHMRLRIKKAKKVSDWLCVAELQTMQEKIRLMKAKAVNEDMQNNVCIYADRARRERIILTAITNKAEKEMRRGKNVRFGYMKIYVDGDPWVWSDQNRKMVKVGQNLILLPARSRFTAYVFDRPGIGRGLLFETF